MTARLVEAFKDLGRSASSTSKAPAPQARSSCSSRRTDDRPAPVVSTSRLRPGRIANLAGLKRDGRLHLPDLQRGFVWSADRVRALHDSLYRSYPVGALLLWEPKWGGEPPFSTRAWDICPPDEVSMRGTPATTQPVKPGSRSSSTGSSA